MVELKDLIPWVGCVAGVVFGFSSWMRNRGSDDKTQARWMGTIDTKLNQICDQLGKLEGVPQNMAHLQTQYTALQNSVNELWAEFRQHCQEGRDTK